MTCTDKFIFDISICPTHMDPGGDIIDEDKLLETIRAVAEEHWGKENIQFECLQIGYRQGDDWMQSWKNGARNDSYAERLVDEYVDWSDEALYVTEDE